MCKKIFILITILSFVTYSIASSSEGGTSGNTGNFAHAGNPLCVYGQEAASMTMLFLIVLMVLSLLILYIFMELKLEHYIPETVAVIFVGLILGFIIRFFTPQEVSKSITQFDPAVFFQILLPLLIFDAGYTLSKGEFFRNIGATSSYAFIGTTISTITVAAILYIFGYMGWSLKIDLIDCLIYGSLISAVDTVATIAIFAALKVNSTLHYLVFGESVLNDAVAIVLFQTFKLVKAGSSDSLQMMILNGVFRFLLAVFGSIALGVVFSLLAALFFKYVDLRKHPHLEICFFVLFAYIPYLFALPYLSGVMCAFSSGVIMSHYVSPNLSKEANDTLKHVIRTIAFLFETFLALFIGMAIFAFDHGWDWRLIIVTIAACLVGRMLNIYPLTAILNSNRKTKVDFRSQFILFWSGLRGSMAFALVLDFKSIPVIGNILFTTTIIVILVTLIIFGGGTLPLLKLLKIETQADVKKRELLTGIVEVKEERNAMVLLDERYLTPVFVRKEYDNEATNRKPKDIKSPQLAKFSKSVSSYDVASKNSGRSDNFNLHIPAFKGKKSEKIRVESGDISSFGGKIDLGDDPDLKE